MDISIFVFIVVGFIAQMIDGSLGMAYGVSANSFLLTLGLSPAVASASVHASEVVTTLVSGLSHLKFGNIDKRMVLNLLIPGVIGGGVGAYLLTSIDGVTFAEAWPNRVSAELDGLPVHLIGKADLLRNKAACARPQDVADLEQLQGF